MFSVLSACQTSDVQPLRDRCVKHHVLFVESYMISRDSSLQWQSVAKHRSVHQCTVRVATCISPFATLSVCFRSFFVVVRSLI